MQIRPFPSHLGWRAVAVAAVLALAGGVAAQASEPTASRPGDDAPRVRVTLDADTLEALHKSPTVQHLKRMAEELRLASEARATGKAAPEITTDELQVVTLPSGMTRARLGVSQLNTALVRFSSGGEAIAACVDGSRAGEVAAPANVSTDARGMEVK